MAVSFEINDMIECLRNNELLTQEEIYNVCKKSVEIFITEPNIVYVHPPVTICGDVHGQFYDLLELFLVAGEMPETNYLFLGDYVDRGYHSIETIMYLLLLKLRYPDKITLIRGNHEARSITQAYGFYDECLRKYGSAKVWNYCTDLFDTLPVAAIIGNGVLALHGGLSPSIQNLDQIKNLHRRQEVPNDGALCDIMWSDPGEGLGWTESPRGAGYMFGEDIVKRFIRDNGLHYIVRAHQLVMEGYKWQFKNKILTVWSAPNYCYRCGNLAAVLELDENMTRNFITFEAAPPDVRLQSPQRLASEYFI